MNDPWVPNLSGQVTPDVEYAIRYLYTQIYKLGDTHTQTSLVSKPTIDVKAILQQAKIQAPLNLPTQSTSSAGTSSNLLYEVTLSAGTTAITYAAGSPEDRLAVFLTQPGGGGGKITWNAIFKLVGADDIDTRANKVSAYEFVSRTDGNWWLVGMILGRP